MDGPGGRSRVPAMTVPLTGDALIADLHTWIITTCNVVDPPDAPQADALLFGDDSPYGIDSLDAMEIVVGVHKRYGVRIDSQETSRRVLASLRTLATYISDHRPTA
jgi:acyl carrier protein